MTLLDINSQLQDKVAFVKYILILWVDKSYVEM